MKGRSCTSLRVSVLMTTNAAFHIGHQREACQELGYDQRVHSLRLSRKLMLKKMEEGYENQDLVFLKHKENAHNVGENLKRGNDVMVIKAQGSDPTQFTAMDYSYVRRRRPIHNNFSPKSINSP
ncbi:hypothetical protein R6Q57_021939 [Mikania cordata]